MQPKSYFIELQILLKITLHKTRFKACTLNISDYPPAYALASKLELTHLTNQINFPKKGAIQANQSSDTVIRA